MLFKIMFLICSCQMLSSSSEVFLIIVLMSSSLLFDLITFWPDSLRVKITTLKNPKVEGTYTHTVFK